ncbi:hypothetical protein CPB86DRAFT_823851, partial [Serendipita vermifera]
MAVYRIPLEIWEEILIYSISAPILPSSDNSLLRAILLLQHDCGTLQKVEVTRTRLRLVCRSWNEIIKRLSVQFVHEGDPKVTPIPASTLRVEFVKANYFCCILRKHLERQAASMKTSYPSVEALITWNGYQYQPDLERFPNIRILSTDSLDPFQSSTLIRNLTHLQVCLIYSKGASREELVFPNLHTLGIDFGNGFYPPYSGRDFCPNTDNVNCLNLSLPNLVNLKCVGEVTGNLTSWMIYELIEKFGSRLKGFFMDVYRQEGYYTKTYLALPENLWKQCTSLNTLGLSLTQITPNARPPQGYHLLHLIFCDVDEPDDWQCRSDCVMTERSWMNYEVSISLFMALDWTADALQMDISWDQLQNRISDFDNPGCLETIYRFLRQLKWAGRDLMDKYDNGLESEEGEEFVGWLDYARNISMEVD